MNCFNKSLLGLTVLLSSVSTYADCFQLQAGARNVSQLMQTAKASRQGVFALISSGIISDFHEMQPRIGTVPVSVRIRSPMNSTIKV